jgi:hypothetical protein
LASTSKCTLGCGAHTVQHNEWHAVLTPHCSFTCSPACWRYCRKPFSDDDTDEDNDDDDYVDDMDITKKSTQNNGDKGVGRRVSVCAEPLDPNAVSYKLTLLYMYTALACTLIASLTAAAIDAAAGGLLVLAS